MRNAALQCPKSPDNAVRHEWSGHSESLATESNLWRIRHEERDFRPSLLSREKKILLTRALGGARTAEPARTCSSHVCLSAGVSAFAEPDIHASVLSTGEKNLLTRALGGARTAQPARNPRPPVSLSAV